MCCKKTVKFVHFNSCCKDVQMIKKERMVYIFMRFDPLIRLIFLLDV